MTIELPTSVDTVIVGAGLAGLAAANRLHASGQTVAVIEASDGVGGRVRTDVVDGFRLDRGLQVLFTNMPEVERQLDLRALDVRAFEPGIAVWIDGDIYQIGDPFRNRSAWLEAMRSPVLPFADKFRLLRLRTKLARGDASRLLRSPEQSTRDRIHSLGFSETAINRLLEPLFAGIQFDPTLAASSRVFDTVFRSLSEGPIGLPSLGMGRISAQLAERLPAESIVLNTPVQSVAPHKVLTRHGTVSATDVIVATDGPTAARLVNVEDPGSLPAACLWFAADIPPVMTRTVILDGARSGPIRNLAVMTNVAPSYAPAGRHLIGAACPGDISTDLAAVGIRQLREWFGPQVSSWDLLRIDRIVHGQPSQTPPLRARQRTKLQTGLWVCGDHRDTASLQGALFSGRRTAEAILGLDPSTT